MTVPLAPAVRSKVTIAFPSLSRGVSGVIARDEGRSRTSMPSPLPTAALLPSSAVGVTSDACRVQVFRFSESRVEGLRVHGPGVQGSGFHGPGFRVSGSRFSGFRV